MNRQSVTRHANIRKHAPQFARGFTLIEMAIVLLIIGLALGMILNLTGGLMDAQKRKAVRIGLDTVDIALANFVAVNKRLPCPANGSIASGALNAGVETLQVGSGLCNPANQSNGVLPWVTLGISENDALDPWNGRITYRVQPALASNLLRLMNMSWCDPAGIAATGAGGICNTSCTGSACTSPSNFLANKGLDVWNGAPDPANVAGWATRGNNPASGTGAAYVMISHGPSGTGAYNNGGVLQPGTVLAGSNETPNLNNQAIAIPSALATTYRDARLNDNPAPPIVPPLPPQPGYHFDDSLSHPSIVQVLNKASLGPRAH